MALRSFPWKGKAWSTVSTILKKKTPRTLQYFEIGGNRGVYKDGWWAGSRWSRVPSPVRGDPGSGRRRQRMEFGTVR